VSAEPAPARLTGVLPLRGRNNRDNADYRRAELLFRSLRRFAAPGTFARFQIVCPADEVAEVSRRFADCGDLRIETANELDLVPGLSRYADLTGWSRQQVVKLAACAAADTDYCITFDADVVFTRPCSLAELLPEGKALLDPHWEPHRPYWWRASARLLHEPVPAAGPTIGVTPVILASEPCASLIRYLSGPHGGDAWLDRLLPPLRQTAWQQYLPGFRYRHRWSEYTLYYLMLQKLRSLDRYHRMGGTATTPQTLVSRNSVWELEAFRTWDPAPAFDAADPALFCIVQSNMHVDPETVERLLAPFLA
jgi:hypothetical protein